RNPFPVPSEITWEDRMSAPEFTRISALLQDHEQAILGDWVREQLSPGVLRRAAPRESDLHEQSKNILQSIKGALRDGGAGDMSGVKWDQVRESLSGTSHFLANEGCSPAETAACILSLKGPLFTRLIAETNPAELLNQLWTLSALVDKLALHTIDVYQKGRDATIVRQQEEMLE